MNQYQVCLYSFECIPHGDPKYGPQLQNFVVFFNLNVFIFYLSSAHHACRVEVVQFGLVKHCDIVTSSRLICEETD